jgi:PQQ-dependent dehydrogenase (s-GDH family)
MATRAPLPLVIKATVIKVTLVGCSLLGSQACGSDTPDGGPVAGSGPTSGAPHGATGGRGGYGGASGSNGSVIPRGGAGSGGAPVDPEGGAGRNEGGEASGGAANPGNQESFAKRVVVENLSSPWEITWGPDSWLWVTERVGKRVVRINPDDGTVGVALEIDEVRQEGAQDGLLGMALHPQLLAGTDQDFVYVAYSYDAAAGRRIKIRRYTYDASSGTLSAPLDLLSELPASNDHNGGRLGVGPDAKLYYSIGDQGENQFDRKCNLDRAQDLPTADQITAGDFQTYQGKILRMNLDGSIPSDNPELNGVRSHVFSFGHRNPQGIAFGPTGRLFSSEQGPKSDDELNRIEAGKNYGWPQVAGFKDDKAYVYANWSAAPDCEQLDYSDYTIPATVPQQKESDWADPNFMAPLLTFYTVESSYQFEDPKCEGNANICWPTIAPSSLELYAPAKHVLSGWTDSLLITSLKQGTVYRVPLSADGAAINGAVAPLFKTTNRYRDVAVKPDGRAFYVITDAQGSTASLDGGATSSLENKGSVLEFAATPRE